MKKTLFLLLPLSALLFACGGSQSAVTPVTPSTPSTPSAPTVTSVSISSASALQVGATEALTATVTYSDGTASASAAGFTSSDPNAVAVSSGGMLTARHLTSSNAGVTITASAGGQSATTSLATYGFDVAGGTNQVGGSTPGTYLRARYRAQDGSGLSSDTTYTVSGPSGFNGGKALSVPIYALNSFGAASSSTLVPVSGSYTATLTLNGTTFTKSFAIDATQFFPAATPSGLTLTGTTGSYTFSGALPYGAAGIVTNLWTQGSSASYVASTTSSATLPISGSWLDTNGKPFTVPAGTYDDHTVLFNFVPLVDTEFPDQVNRGLYTTGTTTIN